MDCLKRVHEHDNTLDYPKKLTKQALTIILKQQNGFGMNPYERKDWVDTCSTRFDILLTATKQVKRMAKKKVPQWVLKSMPWLCSKNAGQGELHDDDNCWGIDGDCEDADDEDDEDDAANKLDDGEENKTEDEEEHLKEKLQHDKEEEQNDSRSAPQILP